MDLPILLGFVVLILWGIWAFCYKLAAMHLSPVSAMIFSSLTSIPVLIILLALVHFRPDLHPKGVLFAVIGGIVGSIAGIFFIWALSKGNSSVIVTMTALYPVVTILLSALVLQERITLAKGAAILLSLAALVLFAV